MLMTLAIVVIGIGAVSLGWMIAIQQDARIHYIEQQRAKAERAYYFGGY